MRDVALPYCGALRNIGLVVLVRDRRLAASCACSLSRTGRIGRACPGDGDADATGTTMPLVQVHEPAGMLMMSPLPATWIGPLRCSFTSLRLQSPPCTSLRGRGPKEQQEKSDKYPSWRCFSLSISFFVATKIHCVDGPGKGPPRSCPPSPCGSAIDAHAAPVRSVSA